MPNNGKVLLAWVPQPIAGTNVIQQGLMDSFCDFVDFDNRNRKIFAGYLAVNQGYIPMSREAICRHFLSQENEWLLMIDWDITFKPEHIYQLLDGADAEKRPIIAGTYLTYFGGPNGDVLRPCWHEPHGTQEYAPAMGLALNEITQCSSVGMGFTLIHRSVLEAMNIRFVLDPWHFFGHDVIQGERCGEDITFCARARSLGFSVWGHGGVHVGHTKAHTFTVHDIVNPILNVKNRDIGNLEQQIK